MSNSRSHAPVTIVNKIRLRHSAGVVLFVIFSRFTYSQKNIRHSLSYSLLSSVYYSFLSPCLFLCLSAFFRFFLFFYLSFSFRFSIFPFFKTTFLFVLLSCLNGIEFQARSIGDLVQNPYRRPLQITDRTVADFCLRYVARDFLASVATAGLTHLPLALASLCSTELSTFPTDVYTLRSQLSLMCPPHLFSWRSYFFNVVRQLLRTDLRILSLWIATLVPGTCGLPSFSLCEKSLLHPLSLGW